MTDYPYESAAMVASGIGLVAAAGLWIFFIVGWHVRISGRATLVAASATLLWLIVLCLRHLRDPVDPLWIAIATVAETLAHATWFGVCMRVLSIGLKTDGQDSQRRLLLLASLAAVALGMGTALAFLFGVALAWPATAQIWSAAAVGQLIMSTNGLLLIEQIMRNTRNDSQWNLKFLVLGLGVLFGYDFVMSADTVMFRASNTALDATHGAIIAITAPLLAIATTRNRARGLHVNLSRSFVLRTGTLVITGTYLLLMSAGGFWLRQFGGNWGEVLAVLFVTLTVTLGGVLIWSRTLRERFSLLVTRTLFDSKHDYRDEWLRITRTMLENDGDQGLGQRGIRALGETLHAHRGGLWQRSEHDTLVPAAQLKTAWTLPFSPRASAQLIRHFEREEALLRIRDADADTTELAQALVELRALTDSEFAIPLLLDSRLCGLVVLTPPETGEALDWEDQEIIAVAGRQIASLIALQSANDELSLQRQMAAFNQMTAFVVHDLKTVVSQLSLLSQNADKHRDNPQFVDDMIKTNAHSVTRMQALLRQLRDPGDGDSETTQAADVGAILEAVVERQRALQPLPTLDRASEEIRVVCKPGRLLDAIAHLVQNAQEATPQDGRVEIRVRVERPWALVTITDTGQGMTTQFVQERLFKPFESTKGLSGMGVGTWQARSYVQSLGGVIDVESTPGTGSRFIIRLPLYENPEAATQPGDVADEASGGAAAPMHR